MAITSDTWFSRVGKSEIIRNPSNSNAVTASEIAYNLTQSIAEKITEMDISTSTRQIFWFRNRRPSLYFTENLDSWWTDWYATWVVSHDVVDKYIWGWSIKIVCPTTAARAWMRKNITNYDLSTETYGFSIAVKSTNWSQVTEAVILLGAAWFGTFKSLDILSKINPIQLENNEWHELVFSKDDFVDFWAASWATVEDMIIAASASAWNSPTVWFDNFQVFNQNPLWISKGFAPISFDDGWETQWTIAKPLLDKYGIKATFFIIPEYLGLPLYMTQEQVDQLHEEWHTIALHWATNLTTFTGAALDAEINSIVAYRNLHPQYRGAGMFALPNGWSNAEVQEKLKVHFDFIFTIDEWKAFPYNFTPYRLPRRSVINSNAVALLTGLADSARVQKGMQIINFHKITTIAPQAAEEYQNINFESLLVYLSTPANNILTNTIDYILYKY